MKSVSPFVRDLVLIGGGHAHVQTLRRFGMNPIDGVRVTVISRESHSPYSGMLPGHVAGEYGFDDIHVDLMRMCVFADARFICDQVVNIDADRQKIEFSSRPSVRYDVLSVNVGGELGAGLNGRELVIPVKPIAGFLPRWNQVLQYYVSRKHVRLAIVGGGPGSVELALSIAERHEDQFDIELITAESTVLVQQPNRAQRKAHALLESLNVRVIRDYRVHEVLQRDNSDGNSGMLCLRSLRLIKTRGMPMWYFG